jgi:hypothetical protein
MSTSSLMARRPLRMVGFTRFPDFHSIWFQGKHFANIEAWALLRCHTCFPFSAHIGQVSITGRLSSSEFIHIGL